MFSDEGITFTLSYHTIFAFFALVVTLGICFLRSAAFRGAGRFPPNPGSAFTFFPAPRQSTPVAPAPAVQGLRTLTDYADPPAEIGNSQGLPGPRPRPPDRRQWQ